MKTFKQFVNESKKEEKYPLIRYITEYGTGIKILESGEIYSRPEAINNDLIEDEKDDLWEKRSKSDNKNFNTEDLIFCTVDWFGDYKYETGHGPVMLYFNDDIWNEFNITLTLVDSFDYDGPILNKKDISKIYEKILNFDGKKEKLNDKELIKKLKELKDKKKDDEFYESCVQIIISNLNHKNDNGFYDRYSEIQIHTKSLSIDLINFIKKTDNFLNKESDNKKEKFDKLSKNILK